jgi:aquaporin Z
MTQETSRQALAEAIGTFMLLLIGAGSVVLSAATTTGALIPALAHGLTIMAAASAYGHISGGHFNPAVSFALWMGGHLPSQKLLVYIVAQLVGAFIACAILLVVLPTPGALGQTVPAANVNELDIILVEGVLTFMLVSAVYQLGVYGKGGAFAPLFIGLTLTALILMGGPLTGASLNPARTLAPAFLGEDVQNLPEIFIYLVGIFGGAALAAILHMDTLKPSTVPEVDAPRRRKR